MTNRTDIVLPYVEKESTILTNRIESIDIFRGMTIFAMIFVNDLASVQGIPFWMKHMHADADGMTFVDVVFPAFLFIIGMAIPFSISSRLSKKQSQLKILKHILQRSISLIVLGILTVNTSSLNESATGINRHLWLFLVFVSAILILNQYPKSEGRTKYFYNILKAVGLISLIILAVIYRSGGDNDLSWLQTKWWGILGLIGWAYLFTSIIYLIFKNNKSVLLGMIFLSILLYIGDKEGALNFLKPITEVLWLGGHVGGHTTITLSGILVSTLFFNKEKITHQKRIFWIISFAVFLFVAGFLLRPLYGISKIYSTPTWSLYSSAFCCLTYSLIYWLSEVLSIKKWVKFLEPAGKNPLLAYILPDIIYSMLIFAGINILSYYFGFGIIGIIRAIIFTLLMLWLTSLLVKAKIRLQL